ncbi:LPXTG cell wall anchor domain-containing protein [Streptomyces sp. NPDC056747]|uniref:LPXTG cell wall anchor domain-containing protein n=1 Tax=Streptomyces sp. NPDC056747 TaxID=3345935 RepID=UPI0036AD4C9A
MKPSRVRTARPSAFKPRGAGLLAIAMVTALGSPMFVGHAVAEPNPQAVDRHAVVLVNFRNRALVDPQQAHDRAVQNFFGSTDSLASYYAKNSGNRMSVVPAKGDGVFGPFTLDLDDAAACNNHDIAEAALKKVADVEYDHVSIVIHTDYCKNWWGLGEQPGSTTWFHEQALADKTAIIHELGHNLGFHHQDHEVCTTGSFTGCTRDNYSHRTPMGAGGDHKGLTAPELISRKWLTTQQTATPSTTTTVHLTPLHAAGGSGVRAIDLPLGTGGDRIVVEYRAPKSGTSDIDVPRGVNVFRVPQGNYGNAVMISNSKASDAVTKGSLALDTAFSDTGAQLTISVARDGVAADGADVRVQFGASGGAAAPKPTASKPTTTAPTKPAPRPVQTVDHADTPAVIGSTHTPSSGAGSVDSHGSASESTHADGTALAETGAGVTVPAVLGAGLLACGAAAVLLLRRRRPLQRR